MKESCLFDENIGRRGKLENINIGNLRSVDVGFVAYHFILRFKTFKKETFPF